MYTQQSIVIPILYYYVPTPCVPSHRDLNILKSFFCPFVKVGKTLRLIHSHNMLGHPSRTKKFTIYQIVCGRLRTGGTEHSKRIVEFQSIKTGAIMTPALFDYCLQALRVGNFDIF